MSSLVSLVRKFDAKRPMLVPLFVGCTRTLQTHLILCRIPPREQQPQLATPREKAGRFGKTRRLCVYQKLSSALNASVVWCSFDVEKKTQKRIDVHLVDGGGFNSLAEVGSPCEEDGSHGGELVAVAVLAFLVLSLPFFHILKEDNFNEGFS